MTALIDRLGFDCDAIDVFGGWGGSSQGIEAAGATILCAANHSEMAVDCHSINFPNADHWLADLVDPSSPLIVDRKGKKVPGRYIDPAKLPRARFAWFSPSCRHHSQANAMKLYARGRQLTLIDDDDFDEEAYANSERSRATMLCVLRYAMKQRPEIIVVENVLEVTRWGPGGDGTMWHWWLTEIRKKYEVRCLFFNSMFFAPVPQSRDRIYIVAWRKGNKAPDLDYRPTAYCMSQECGGEIVAAVQSFKPPKATWAMREWGKYQAQYDYRCPDCRRVVHPASWMALSALDLRNLGPTLEERISRGKRPAPNTWERIRRAVQKYRYAPPIIIEGEPVAGEQVHVAHAETVNTANTGSKPRHDGNRARSITEQMPTLAQRNTVGVAMEHVGSGRPRARHAVEQMPTLVAEGKHEWLMATVKNNGAESEVGYRAHHASEPMGALVAGSRPQSILALIVPNRTNNVARHAGEQLGPVMTSATQAVVVQGAGNTSERPGQTRARSAASQMFTQTGTNEFGLATVAMRGDHFQDAHGGEPMATVAGEGATQAVVTALFSKINGGPGDTAWHGVHDPLNTITSNDTHGLVVIPWVDQWLSDPVYVTEQMATITARLRHTLASIEPSDEPVTDEMLMQVRWRMFEPDPELRRGMGFADDYVLIGNKTQKTAGLGAAVTPPVASWITERCIATLRGN